MVQVVDAIMGTGKTTAAINYMNSHPEQKFIYITPFLDEVDRVKKQCKGFYSPDEEQFGTKLRAIKHLFSKGNNIVSTHSMFQLLDDEIIDLCYEQDYTLILDEVADVVKKYNGTETHKINQNDVKILLDVYTDVDEETGMLSWKSEYSDYSNGKYDEEKQFCKHKCLAKYNDVIMIWLFPINIFKMFSNIFILTYMFDAQLQRCYFDYYDVDYKYVGIRGDTMSDCVFDLDSTNISTIKSVDYSSLINVVDNEKMNRIGDLSGSLSKSWYNSHEDDELMGVLKKNSSNFFKNICKSKSNENLWTTFKDFKYVLKGKGYSKGFESCNCRATNKHRAKSNIAYLVNRYFDPNIKQFFNQHEIEVDEDGYALSEMLQFIWRSAIRDGKPINIYIPSQRMRKLLLTWLERK